MSWASVFVKVVLFCVISWNLTPLPIFLSDSNIDKKRVLFSILSAQEPIDKKGYPFSSFANQCNSSLMLAHSSTLRRKFHLQKSFHESVFGILNIDIDKKGLQNQSIVVWWQTLKKGNLYSEKTKVAFKFSKNYLLDKKGYAFLSFSSR